MKSRFAWTIAVALAVTLLLSVAQMLRADDITGRLDVNPNILHKQTGASSLRETVDSFQKWTMNTNAASQITELWVHSIVLTAKQSRVYDLYGGLTNSFGDTFNFDLIKLVMVKAASSNLADVGIGGAISNQWSTWNDKTNSIVRVPADSGFYLFTESAAGYAVSNLSSDLLSVTNYHATSNVVFDIILGGK